MTDKKETKKKNADFPRHTIGNVIKLPKAIIEQNAGHTCTTKDLATYCNTTYNSTFRSELSSADKYGLLEKPKQGEVLPSDIAKKIIRPQESEDMIQGFREAVLKTPVISEVYEHYRGENLPDEKFLRNALSDTFNIPEERIDEFIRIFEDLLQEAKLLEIHDDKKRIIDFKLLSDELDKTGEKSERIKKLEKTAKPKSSDTCFVMMPFADPIGSYYKSIYEPAILKAGLKPVRADDDIFGTGKIIDQIWTGITSAKILVAELTNRNPNVFYELGLAHALNKPVVLVSSNEDDVPFDLRHIRVIYYNMTDPFWGQKLIEKVAENILSAITNPEEAMFKTEIEN